MTGDLSAVISADRVLETEAVAERATSYWDAQPMQAKRLLMPQTTEEVAAILRWCHEHNQTVVTQGGLTGCVVGAVPTRNDVVLSLEKMNRIVDVDPVGGTAVIEAGAVLQTVQDSLREQGLYFPLDLGARGSCTIGGNVATNAGGMNVLRYGMTRNLVLGLEAVLADGTVMSSMNQMLKNNAGYDLKQLFIGSEGTLGIVTRVVVRLFPRPASRQDALVAMRRFADVTGFLQRVQRDLGGNLSAFEIMWGDYFAAVTDTGFHRAPMDRSHPFYVVLQAEGSHPATDDERFEAVLGQALEDELIVDAVIPRSEAQTRALWNIREEFDPILKPEPVFLYDVSLPIRAMPDYVDRVRSAVVSRWPDGKLYAIGHVADGNLHFFLSPGVPPDSAADLHGASDECVYEPLRELGGSVSAEHGIGTEKLKWLPHSRSPEEIALMATLKRSLDPKNILNPGRVIAL